MSIFDYSYGGQSIFVPLYAYPSPTTFWDTVRASIPPVSMIVANVSSGPGVSPDSNYTLVIGEALDVGIRVLGYVDTNYGAVSSATVESNVDLWFSLYGIRDIFFDRVASASSGLSYYTTITNYVHNAAPGAIVTLNPGTPPDEGYMALAENVVVFEGDGATYSSFTVPGWVNNYPASSFTHLVYNVSSGGAMATALTQSATLNCGNIYITDDILPNPYGVIPSYWSTEATDVAATEGGLITCSLNGLAAGAAQQSVSIDNSSTLYLEILLQMKIVWPNTSISGIVNVILVPSIDGTHFDGNATGTDSSYTNPVNGVINHVLVNITPIPNGTSVTTRSFTYYSGLIPPKFAIVVWNDTNQALGTGSTLRYVGVGKGVGKR